ncbi:hypothetical protein [Latilactobacillus sakei]|nr:hypothetical protein [Latilactobacillus sakei]MCM1635813.1 hypothetical protein [Latilactobacillus sakei]
MLVAAIATCTGPTNNGNDAVKDDAKILNLLIIDIPFQKERHPLGAL